MAWHLCLTRSTHRIAIFFAGYCGSMPAFGALNMFMPTLAFEIAILYTCCAIAQSYDGTGYWAVLSGFLCFLSCLLLTWGDFPLFWLCGTFLCPYIFVSYTYLGGAAKLPNVVDVFGNGLAVALALGIALG
jgi:hypothetical protein